MSAAMNVPARGLFLAITILAIAGIGVSSVSLDHHFRKSKTSYCDFGQSFDCDLVNRSEYSTVAGVPVALIGILGYAALLAFATFYRDKAETPGILVVASLGGLGFALYLTYIEKYVLFTWCILCLSSLALMLSIAVLSVLLLLRSTRRAEVGE
jgi:vitamin-K-epoxide reductase (warfarin-sensitive)